MDIRFDNKVAFVTGAAGGIGFAAAKCLQKREPKSLWLIWTRNG